MMQKRKELGRLKAFAPLLGKTVGEAETWLRENARVWPEGSKSPVVWVRVLETDGNPYPANLCDSRADRMNVKIEDGVIVHLMGVW